MALMASDVTFDLGLQEYMDYGDRKTNRHYQSPTYINNNIPDLSSESNNSLYFIPSDVVPNHFG